MTPASKVRHRTASRISGSGRSVSWGIYGLLAIQLPFCPPKKGAFVEVKGCGPVGMAQQPHARMKVRTEAHPAVRGADRHRSGISVESFLAIPVLTKIFIGHRSPPSPVPRSWVHQSWVAWS